MSQAASLSRFSMRVPEKIRGLIALLIPSIAIGFLVGLDLPLAHRIGPALIFFVAGGGVFVWSWTAYRDWATPVNLLVIPWLFDLGLFHLQLLDVSIQGTLEPFTYFVILGSLVSFGGGTFLANYGLRGSGKGTSLNTDVSPKRLRLLIVGFFALGFGVWLYRFMQVGGIRVWLNQPAYYRQNLMVPLLDDVYRLVALSGYLIVYYLSAGQRKYKKYFLVMYAVILLIIGSRLARSDLFQYLIVSLVILNLVKKVPLKYVLVGLVLMLALFLIVHYVRGSQFERETGWVREGIVRVPASAPWMASFYTYTVTNIRNVQIAIHRVQEYEWGRNLLYPIWSWTRTKTIMGFESFTYQDWRRIYGLGIFRPYLIDFYKDFGVFGTIVLSALLGFLSNWLYWQARARHRGLAVWLYAVLSFALLLSFVDNFFSDSGLWLLGLEFIVTYLLVRYPRSKLKRLSQVCLQK